MELTKKELLSLREKVLKLKKTNEIEDIIPKQSAYEFLLCSNSSRMNSVALNYFGRTMTYDELFKKIDIAANSFSKMGVKKGDNVAVAMLSTPEAIITFYALNKIGATVYMINATHEKPQIREEMKTSNAKLLVVNDIFYDKEFASIATESGIEKVVTSSLTDSLPRGFCMDKVKYSVIEALCNVKNSCGSDSRCIRWNEFMKNGLGKTINLSSGYEANSIAAVSSTSGSTGNPKKPAITNENMNAMPIQMGMTCDAFAPNDVIFTSLPIWIFYSLVNSIHEPLCLGVTVALDPLVDCKKISSRLRQYRFNHWNTIPSYVEDMLKDKRVRRLDLSHLKTITTGGDYRTPKLKQEGEELLRSCGSNIEIGQGYGASETCGSFCYTYEDGMPAESVGKPLIGNAYKIINLETGEICGPNESGELYLYTPTLMKFYYDNPDDTDKLIVVDEDGVRWYKTEDVAHYDEEGRLFIDGRLRRIEISRDSNGMPTKVFPDRVKQVISMHPLVEQCEILMVPDDERITRPVAYLVLKEGVEYSDELEKEIISLCTARNIESYILPTEYLCIDSLPKTPGLKVDLKELQKKYDSSHKGKVKTKNATN